MLRIRVNAGATPFVSALPTLCFVGVLDVRVHIPRLSLLDNCWCYAVSLELAICAELGHQIVNRLIYWYRGQNFCAPLGQIM